MMKRLFDSLLAQPLRSMEPWGYKGAQDQSGVESPDENQLEQDFARLAYMFVQDRAPGLMKYLLGFEVVNREEDGSKAVGIFGFKVGKDYYYVPAFFLNNQIKGVDMLLAKRTNTFVPLQEDWINFIVNRQTIELGGGTDTDKVQRDFESPNFRFVSIPPTGPGGKIAEAKDGVQEDLNPWTLKQAWAVMQAQLQDLLEKEAEFQDALAGAVCAMTGQPLEKYASDQSTVLKQWLEKCGGPQAMSSFLTTLTSNAKFANAALTCYPDVAALYVHEFDARAVPQKRAAQISVVTEINEYENGETKHRLVRDGFAIKDTRPEAEKSEAYDVDYERHFSNPSTSGTYQVLLAGGRTTKSWVFMPSAASRNPYVTIVEQDKLMHRLAEPSAVYVRDTETGDTSDAYEKAVALDDMELRRNYILIDEKGHALGPVEIKSLIEEDGKRTKLKVDWIGQYDVVKAPTYGHDFENLHRKDRYRDSQGKLTGSGDCGPCCTPCCGSNDNFDAKYLAMADHKGKVTKSGTDTLVVPSNWKALRIYDPSDDDQKLESYEAERIMRDAFRLGTLVDVNESLVKNAFVKLAVNSDDGGQEFYFRVNGNFATPPMSYKQAYITLVSRFGLGVDSAEDLLKHAAAEFKCRRLIKLGQMSQLVGVSMAQPREQTASTDPYAGLPMYDMEYAQQTAGAMTGVPPRPNANIPGINIGGEAEMDQGAQDMANQAAQAGQKNIFDHASVGGLSKIYDTGAVLDSYVPELMKALDRLGRILFLFYWKNEDFAERYGSNDLAEMEDLIRNVFKSFGELVLQLRKKAIDKEDANTVEM